MKNRIVISLLAGTLALGACNLDETPYGFYSEDNFFKTAAGVGSEFTVILPMNQKVYEGRENTEFILNDGNSVPAEKKNEIRPMVEIASMAAITTS